jgi:alkanesulfonate monooxygenase SsuD/methylene tetrahydromethanopterin reductase-like flavin-dependent oxidoreductase (luciferase family)
MARDLGYTSFWAGQHFLAEPYQQMQLVPALARISAEVPGVTIGTMVLLLPLYQPVLAAEELATLDIITGGKLVVGVALGYRDIENEALGSPANERLGRFRESLDILNGLWKGEPFSYEGRYFRIPECQPTLIPIQRPRPPIWLAANSDGAVRRAARLGDAWAIAPHSPLPVLKRQMSLYKEERVQHGLAVPDVVPIRREVYVAPTHEEAWRQAAEYLGPKYATYRKWGQHTVLPEDDDFAEDFAALARERFIIGSPDEVIETLTRYRDELGVTDVMMTSDRAGMPYELSQRCVRLVGEKVIPALT